MLQSTPMGRIYDATWGRGFTAIYDRGLKGTEEAGLRDARRETLAEASGRTVDLGAGTGANLGLYPEAVTELVLAEPDPHMLKRLRVESGGGQSRMLRWSKRRRKNCPSRTRASTPPSSRWCSARCPTRRRRWPRPPRVLKPGGRLLFVEHVRAEDPGLARWQDRLERPWRFVADGCHCNRDTVATIEASPLSLERVERGPLPKAPPLVRPLVRGSAKLLA